MRHAAWLLAILCGVTVAEAQPVLPPGFGDAVVASIASPTGLAFTPDGRLLVTTQPGRLRVIRDGTLLSTPAIDLSSVICADSERGLLGVAVDPAFAANRTIYLFYTYKKSGVCERNTSRSPVNRVSRFVLPDSNVVDRASEVVLLDNIPSPNGNHNGGDLHFGKDGLLYVSVGDGGCDYAGNSGCAGANDAARDMHVLLGKILRITRDGGIPASNPFRGTASVRCHLTGRAQPGQVCQETFASGLRNPFRIAFDPDAAATRFFINDVGQNAWEEIDLGQAGADYGWNIREGHCANGSTTDCGLPPGSLTNPIFAYAHTGGCASITGGAFVPAGAWPSAYAGAYLFGDYVCGTIFQLTERSDGSFARSTFASGLGGSSAVAMIFGPHAGSQALFYTTYAGGGQVRRIASVANRAPQVSATASPTSGPLPLAVRFDGSASRDPDGDALTFRWDFRDGSALEPGAIVSHTYTTAGSYQARLTVTDARGASATATVTIAAGNRPPLPAITAPSSTARFSVGETITLRGTATDPEDGTLPGSSLSWRVILHHNTHTHPLAGPVAGATATFQAPAPEDLAATTTSHLELELTARDSAGLVAVARRNLNPRTVAVTLATAPPGLTLRVNGTAFTAPRQFTSWHNYVLNVEAASQNDASGQLQVFSAWSDGGAARHAILTPASPLTYTASFVRGVRLAATADAFVRGGSHAARNFGGSPVLETKLSSAEYTRQAYVKFDTRGAATIGSARLRLFGSLADSRSANVPIAVAGTSASWTEGGLTWNTRPVPGGQLSVTRVLDPTPRWYEWDVTSHVRAERAAGRAVVSLALASTVVTSPVISFQSRESTTTNRPELLIGEAPATGGEIVLYAADAAITGATWTSVADASAAAGTRVGEADAGRAKILTPLAQPASHVELRFQAEAGRAYRLWIRGRASGNSWSNDSAFVQFSGSVTSSGTPVYRIGTTGATTYVLEDCTGCGIAGWGWQDNGYGVNVLGPAIYFAVTGPQTLRIQSREDGLSIDQVVLSPSRYVSTRPGAAKNDTTILAR